MKEIRAWPVTVGFAISKSGADTLSQNGGNKWRELGLSYSLTDTPKPHPEVMRQAREIFWRLA
jgi:hypothetical protein